MRTSWIGVRSLARRPANTQNVEVSGTDPVAERERHDHDFSIDGHPQVVVAALDDDRGSQC